MIIGFPVAVSLLGAISFFAVTAKLRNFKVSTRAPASLAKLSVDERQRRIVIASWIMFSNGCVMLAGAAILFWLAK
jgi:hypothetical protein